MAQTTVPDAAAARAVELVRNGDLSTLTFKSIMSTLQSELGDEIRSRKAELRQLVNRTIEEMNESESSGAEDELDAETFEPPRSRSKRKAAESPKRKSKKRAATGSGIQKAIGISAQLAAFLGVEADEDGPKMARTEVTRRMIQYVKKNSLQSATDGRKIVCDEALTKLLGVEETTFFGLQKVLAPHFERFSSSKPSSPKKKTKDSRVGTRKSAFHKPYVMSDNLQAMLGTSEPLSRPQIVKRIWEYVKERNLQNPKDKRSPSFSTIQVSSNTVQILSDHVRPAEGRVVAKNEPLSSASSEIDDNDEEDEGDEEPEEEELKPRIKKESED